MWRYGGGDWLEPWRIYHGLGADFRPIAYPEDPENRPRLVNRYRHLLYGFAKAAAIMEEGAKESAPRRRVRDKTQRPPEQVTASGIVLPTGSSALPR